MERHSILLIDHLHGYTRFDQHYSRNHLKNSKCDFRVQLKQLPKRIYLSFIPPIPGSGSNELYVDYVGPLIALLLLGCILQYGHITNPLSMLNTSPIIVLILYSIIMPFLCFFTAKLANSTIGLSEIISMLGYGLYGHIFTVLICIIFDEEESNILFFILLGIFGGLSGTRIAIVMLISIPKPGARFIVCSIVTIFHLLFLIFIHFAYMHRTFKYGHSPTSNL